MTRDSLPAMQTVEDVARALSTTKTTVSPWLREGRLPGVKLGGEWRVRRSDLERAMAEGIK